MSEELFKLAEQLSEITDKKSEEYKVALLNYVGKQAEVDYNKLKEESE